MKLFVLASALLLLPLASASATRYAEGDVVVGDGGISHAYLSEFGLPTPSQLGFSFDAPAAGTVLELHASAATTRAQVLTFDLYRGGLLWYQAADVCNTGTSTDITCTIPESGLVAYVSVVGGLNVHVTVDRL